MIKEKDGFKYPLKPFEEYTHRHKVEVDKTNPFNGVYSVDLYTDNPSKDWVLAALKKSKFVRINPKSIIKIVHSHQRTGCSYGRTH